jgi:stress-induced-phosphoprotein 1
MIAKIFGRIGTAYAAKNDLLSAKKCYQKSLSEHCDAAIIAKLQATEKAIVESERQAYIAAKSAIAREEGNVAFKGGDFAKAVKLYEESIKRDPSDARGYLAGLPVRMTPKLVTESRVRRGTLRFNSLCRTVSNYQNFPP